MSQWTHVAATIRFDALRLPGMPDQRPILGNTCSFDSPQEDWEKCDVPCGSEGSVKHLIYEEPGPSLAAYVAIIWGDLRDYSNVEEIKKYLERIIEGRMVRQGVAQIEVEFGLVHTLVVENGEWRDIYTVGANGEEE